MRKIALLFCTVLFVGCAPQVENNWRTLDELSPENGLFSVHASAPSQFSVGEAISFEITSERAGRLHVIQVDSQDNVIQMFPNQYDSDNEIAAGKPFVIPCLLYTSPSPRDQRGSRMPSSA